MEQFTPISAALGGALIGLGSALLLYAQGRVTGISGVAGGALKRMPGDRAWRLVFLAGLLLAGAALYAAAPAWFNPGGAPGLLGVALAGLLVGYGTRLGSGCTSGHGVCGLARATPRSFIATMAFMLTGAATVFIVRHGGLL